MAHLTQKNFYRVHSSHSDAEPLAVRVEQLLADQKRDWKRLADGYTALEAARTRQVVCPGYAVTLQFNPQRIASTDARTDEESVRSRPCFLCVDNLPAEQQGILYQDAFLILCNPAPIFKRHFTISHIEHRGQSIERFAGVLTDLARDLSPFHTAFYNGPKSGASAPDHTHFQALPMNALPVELDSTDEKRRLLRFRESSVSLSTLNGYGRQVVVFESDDKGRIEEMLRRWLNAMRKVLNVSDEPLVNILCSYAGRAWKMILFPRTKHRPDAFFLQGPDRLLVSPAAVDMGGFIVTPVQRDFERMTPEMVADIYRQVSHDAATTDRIIDAL